MHDLNDAKYQLKALLLRNNIGYGGKANWSKKHVRWLTEIVLPFPTQQIVERSRYAAEKSIISSKQV